MIHFAPADGKQRDEFFAMMLTQMGCEADGALGYLGLTREKFETLYRTVGEVRAVDDDGMHVGYVWIELRDDRLHIHGIILFPKKRGQGSGTRLIQALCREFEGRASAVELGVQVSNPAAIRFYERLGFEDVTEKTAPGFRILQRSPHSRV